MLMSQDGVTRWKASEQPDTKPQFPIIPEGPIELKLVGASVEERKKNDPDAVPYVNCYFVPAHGDSKARVWKRFFLGTTPNEKGNVTVNMRAGITQYLRGIGRADDADFEIVTDVVPGKSYLNPTQVVTFLKQLDGTTVDAVIKHNLKRDRDTNEETTEKEAEISFFKQKKTN